MKITTLGAGVGASHYLPDKNINKYPPSFLVEWGENHKLLFECSQGVYERLEIADVDYTTIRHLAVSHSHADHYVLIPFLQAIYLKGLWGGEQFKNIILHLYAPNYIVDNVSHLWNLHFPDRKDNYFEWPRLDAHPMSTENKEYTIGTGKLTAKKVFHGFGKCDAVSYRLETPEGVIAYSGDTGDCEGIRAVAKNADIFICEASARVGETAFAASYGHLTPFQAGDIAKHARVKKLILFHYTGLDNDQAMIHDLRTSGFDGEVVLGKDLHALTF